MQIEIILTFLLLCGLSLLATVDMAFGQLSDVGLRRLITEAEERFKMRSSSFLKKVLGNRPRFSFAISATIQILLVAVAVLVTSISLALFEERRIVLVGLLGGLVLAGIFRQIIPLFISTRDPEGTLLFLLPVIRPLLPLMAFAADPFHRLFDRSRRKEQDLENGGEVEELDTEDDIQALIDVGEAEGILEEEEGELIHSILEFGDTRVNEVMTPRPDIVAVPAQATVREARDVMIESKYSRLPVYRDQIDNVEGLVYVRDLLELWADNNENGSISTLVRPVYFVPETKPVAELLEEMQKAHVQLSIVVDEYGGVSGLVTVEDILEEIVGEIEDEDIAGEDLQEIVGQGDGCYEVAGSTEIGKIERLFDMEIETDDFTTIAGLVINESGKVPSQGDVLSFRGLELEVLEADERRIGRLRVKRAAAESADEVSQKWMSENLTMAKKKSRFLQGRRIDPAPINRTTSLAELVDESFIAYNGARLREACQLYTQKMLEPEVTVGLSLTGALTPAGLGISALIPLIKAGFVDWIISTGANLYHDTHFGIGLKMHQGNASTSDIVLRQEEVVRIYDIFFDYSVLLDTDAFFRQIITGKEFQKTMSTAEFHYLAGGYVLERERKLGLKDKSLLAVAHEYGVPIYTSSPGDSSIGMNVAAKALQGNKLAFDPSLDVNETAAIVLAAKRSVVGPQSTSRKRGVKNKPGLSACFILGGGSPKNFLLQTEPQIQEVLGIDERGHDYFLQVTDARPDTGGLSGATPGEAVSWGKVDPDRLPDAVVCYVDSTVALPIITAYALAKHEPRVPKRLYDHRAEFMELLLSEYKKSKRR